MTPRQKALAASSPTLVLLLGTLVWNAVDGHWIDRLTRWLDDRTE